MTKVEPSIGQGGSDIPIKPYMTDRSLALDTPANPEPAAADRGVKRTLDFGHSVQHQVPLLHHMDPPPYSEHHHLPDQHSADPCAPIRSHESNSRHPYANTTAALNQQYGQPHQLALQWIAELMDGPHVMSGDTKAFRMFALKVRSLVSVAKDGWRADATLPEILTAAHQTGSANTAVKWSHNGRCHTIMSHKTCIAAPILTYKLFCAVNWSTPDRVLTQSMPGTSERVSESRTNKPGGTAAQSAAGETNWEIAVEVEQHSTCHISMLAQLGTKGEVELECGFHVSRLLGKLPHDMRSSFQRYIHPQHIPIPTLHDFSDWLEYELQCLNELLLPGSTLGPSLLVVLLRFQEHSIAVSSNIHGMFHQVKLLMEDCPLLRFLCQLGEDVQETVLQSFYMDNCLQSLLSEDHAKALVDKLYKLLTEGGFELQQWTSNQPSVISHLPSEARSNSAELWIAQGNPDAEESALGLHWHCPSDRLRYKLHPVIHSQVTLRTIYEILMSKYDPLGFIVPNTTRAKVIVHIQSCQRDIHIFCDASERTYGSVAYLRTKDISGKVEVAFLNACSRVAPKK
eukprot:superscaffoldBa00003950_g18003